METRSYHGADEAALMALWNATLTHDPIYTPNYFIPGVDVEAYAEAPAFLCAWFLWTGRDAARLPGRFS